MVTSKTVSAAPVPAPVEDPGAYVSIGGLSLATGVPIETLRTWEIRYGFPEPIRRPSGHRRFELRNVERIRRIANALRRGLRAGDVVPASDAALDALVAALPEPPENRAHLQPPDPSTLLKLTRTLDTDGLREYLYAEVRADEALRFIETRIAPAVEMVGTAWERGDLEIAHEHFASERISDVLRGVRVRFEEKAAGPLVVLATLPGESHGLGLQMASVVLAARGVKILLLGTEVPVAEVASIARQMDALAVAVSISISTARGSLPGVKLLIAALPERIKLILGGAGAPAKMKGAEIFQEFGTLDAWAAGLSAAPERPTRN